MIFKSRYDLNDEVYFYNAKTLKVERGTVEGVYLRYYGPDDMSWSYYIQPNATKGRPLTRQTIEEQFIFKNRDEVFKFAYTITEDL